MPGRGSRASIMRDITIKLEELSEYYDENGIPLFDTEVGMSVDQLNKKGLQRFAAKIGAKPKAVGRPNEYGPNDFFVADIEYLTREHRCGRLDACRRYDRE